MQFKKLAEYLQKLEGTASRNEMTVTLAQLFKEADAADGQLIAYLTQGMLGPAYNTLDFGVAEKMLIKALGESAAEKFKKLGDLGLVAQELSEGKGNLEISKVFEKLKEIASTSGSGSQEKKQQ